MARTILPATVLPNSPIHHARGRTTARLQLATPTREADYKRNLLQQRISAQAEEHRLRRSIEEARMNRKRAAEIERENRPRLIENMDSFIDYCMSLVNRMVFVMVLGTFLTLCGRGQAQDAGATVNNHDGSTTTVNRLGVSIRLLTRILGSRP